MEIGDHTVLADLCTESTTVVSMGCTKKLPITCAPVIASMITYTKEEKQMHKQILNSNQCVVELKCDIEQINAQKQREVYTKETFGLSDEDFVIIIAGNRLDDEIKDSFIHIIYHILEQNEHFVIAVIGDCVSLKSRMKHDRIYYWGSQIHFRETIGVGDVFLNPPRQGGGTGAIFAIFETVPVITLNDCDVQINVGSDFVCSDPDEVPACIYRYYSDTEFMERQKENCRKRAKILRDPDGGKSFQILCDKVKKAAQQDYQKENDSGFQVL